MNDATDTYDGKTAADFGVSADDPRWVAMVESERRIEAEYPTDIPPCPDWCPLGAGHEYDSVDGVTAPITYYRFHNSVPNGSKAAAFVQVLERNQGGNLTFDGPSIYLGEHTDLQLDDARQLVADLERAVALLGSLKAQQ